MYVPKNFSVDDLTWLHGIIQQYPLGTLIVNQPSGLSADHLPFLLELADDGLGSLVGHVAINNPVAEIAKAGAECLIVFKGLDSYISPSWYASKQEHGKVVPTWNYQAVHVAGQLSAFYSESELSDFLNRLTNQHEISEPKPWKMADAPESYIQALIKSIVGLKVQIRSIVGKSKMSQNQPLANRQSVAKHLQQSTDPVRQSISRQVAPPE